MLAYFQRELALSTDGVSEGKMFPAEVMDKPVVEAVNDVLAYVLHYRSHIQALHVRFVEVTETNVTLHYQAALKNRADDIVLVQQDTQPFDIEVSSNEIIIKQHVQVNNK